MQTTFIWMLPKVISLREMHIFVRVSYKYFLYKTTLWKGVGTTFKDSHFSLTNFAVLTKKKLFQVTFHDS